jgi:hypothetical protein
VTGPDDYVFAGRAILVSLACCTVGLIALFTLNLVIFFKCWLLACACVGLAVIDLDDEFEGLEP